MPLGKDGARPQQKRGQGTWNGAGQAQGEAMWLVGRTGWRRSWGRGRAGSEKQMHRAPSRRCARYRRASAVWDALAWWQNLRVTHWARKNLCWVPRSNLPSCSKRQKEKLHLLLGLLPPYMHPGNLQIEGSGCGQNGFPLTF